MSPISWIVLLMVLLSGGTLFFSVNASALRSFSHIKLSDAFKAANKEDKHIDSLVENTEKLVLTCDLYRLILNIIILLILLALFSGAGRSQPQISDYIFAFLITAVIFSLLSLAIPHAWAKYAGEKVLCRTYKMLIIFATLAWPVLYVFQLYDRFVRRLAGVVESTPEEKQEEFLNDLEQQKIEGVVDAEEQEMIEKVLELSDTTADEIMTPRTDIVAIEINSDLHSILETISTAGHTRLPVYEEIVDNIIGFIYAKDLLTEVGRNPDDFKLREKLRKAYFVPETKPLRVLLHEFQNRKLHIAVVLDEYGGTAGIVTLEDILEELVGEITDEYEETPSKTIKKIDDNTIEVKARMYVDDLNDEFDLNLPEDEDYDTIGGFVFSHLGYIPKTGESFDYENLKFTIHLAETRKIKRIRIQKIKTSEK